MTFFSPEYFYVTPWSDKLGVSSNNIGDNCREPPPNNLPLQQSISKDSNDRCVLPSSFIKIAL